VVGFGASTVFSKRALRGVSFAMATYLRFGLTALLMGVVSYFSGAFAHVGEVDATQRMVFLLIALTTGGPAIFLYYYGLKRISASVATICELAFPLTAVILEYIIRDNILTLTQWLGVGILLFAIFKVTYVRRKAIHPE
jgi:drug/metabolite transporter (DMT)-like permease